MQLTFVRTASALAAAAAWLVVVAASAAAYDPVLMPMVNETYCDRELHVEGAVIEPSGYEPAGLRYFACSVKFRDIESPRNQSSVWVVRVDRMNIPYHKSDLAGRLPTIKILDGTHELVSFAHPVNTSCTKKDFIAHSLSINFINIPKMSDYKLVVTLHTRDGNCTGYHKCATTPYCISNSLRCNKVDNCGDDSDETEELCPSPVEAKPIIVVASFSVGLIVIIVLIVVMIFFCRTKIAKRKRGITRGITYIRPPKKNDVPRVLPLTENSKDARLRRVGPGFQPAPLAMKNSPSSTSGSLPRLVALKQSQSSLSAASIHNEDRYMPSATSGGFPAADTAALLGTDKPASYRHSSVHDATAAAVDSQAPPPASSAKPHPSGTLERPLLSVHLDAPDAAQLPICDGEPAGLVVSTADRNVN